MARRSTQKNDLFGHYSKVLAKPSGRPVGTTKKTKKAKIQPVTYSNPVLDGLKHTGGNAVRGAREERIPRDRTPVNIPGTSVPDTSIRPIQGTFSPVKQFIERSIPTRPTPTDVFRPSILSPIKSLLKRLTERTRPIGTVVRGADRVDDRLRRTPGESLPIGIDGQFTPVERPEGVTLTPEQLEAGRGGVPSRWRQESRIRQGDMRGGVERGEDTRYRTPVLEPTVAPIERIERTERERRGREAGRGREESRDRTPRPRVVEQIVAPQPVAIQPAREMQPRDEFMTKRGTERDREGFRDRSSKPRVVEQQEIAPEVPTPIIEAPENLIAPQIRTPGWKTEEGKPRIPLAETVPETPIEQILAPETKPAFGGEGFLAGAPEVGTTDYQQDMYNLSREQIQGETRREAEAMKEIMGGQGFRAGESGIANKVIQNILRKGGETLSKRSREMGLSGMAQKYGQEQDAMNLILRLLSGQQAGQAQQWSPYWSNISQAYNQ